MSIHGTCKNKYDWKVKNDNYSGNDVGTTNKTIYNRLVKNAEVSESYLNVGVFHNGVFISGVRGSIDGDLIKRSMSDCIVVLSSQSPVDVIGYDGHVINHPAGVICYKAVKKIDINVHCKLFILRECVFNGLFSVEIPNGEIKNKYEGLMMSIFDSIDKNKTNLINESFAIANILAMSIGDTRTSCLISMAMDDLYLDPLFNLDDLAKAVHMSRRKVQYILSEKETSFSNEIKRRRVAKVKSLIRQSNRKMPMTYYANMAGFKNLNSATKSFMDVTGVSMKEYIYRVLN
ncbi:MAG: helix-turn-helix domain-containing protein [Plesiomonas shigelloides]